MSAIATSHYQETTRPIAMSPQSVRSTSASPTSKATSTHAAPSDTRFCVAKQDIVRARPVVNSTFPENTTTSQVYRINATYAYRCELQTNLETCGTCSVGAVLTRMLFNCNIVLPKRSRDNVPGDISFRRPAMELLIVTMHSWAQPCHTTNSRRRPIRGVVG